MSFMITPPEDQWGLVTSRLFWLCVIGLVGLAATVFTLPFNVPSGTTPEISWWNVLFRIVTLAAIFIYMLWPFRRETLRGIVLDGDLSRLWEVVFAFGTLLALFSDARTADTALTLMCPRVFVVWFLSMLTLVATTVIGQLRNLNRQALQLRQVVGDASTRVTDAASVAGQIAQVLSSSVENLDTHSGDLERRAEGLKDVAKDVSGSTRDLFEAASKVLEVDTQVAELWGYGRPGQAAIDAFLSAIKGRADGMLNVTKLLPKLVEHCHSEAARLVITNVLQQGVARYLAVDPMDFSDSKRRMSFTLEGDYLLYSRLIENFFRNLILILPVIDNDRRVEIFTTLNVPPRMWYNVVVPAGWDRDIRAFQEVCSEFLDLFPRTTPRWEQYKAAQALCITRGRDAQSVGFTRCFLQENRQHTPSPSLFGSQFFERDADARIYKPALDARDGLLRDLAAVKATRCHELELKITALKGAMDRFPQADSDVEIPVSVTIRKPTGEAHPLTPHLYPIYIGSNGQVDPNQWVRLTDDLVANYHTSPQRALVWEIDDDYKAKRSVRNWCVQPDPDDSLRAIPWDLFAVGVSECRSDLDAVPEPHAVDWLFIAYLMTDERGTQTSTRVLPFETDVEEDTMYFQACTAFIRDILTAAQPGAKGLRVRQLAEKSCR
jgi:hypothetical protein